MTRVLKRGFTLIELLIVISIMATLATLVVGVSTKAIRNARMKQASAAATAMEAAITTYFSQQSEWPGQLENVAKDPESYKSDIDGTRKDLDANPVIKVKSAIAQSTFRAVIETSMAGSNPLMDLSVLYVRMTTNGRAKPFREALREGASPSSVTVGYQNANGKFSEFILRYNAVTEQAKVGIN